MAGKKSSAVALLFPVRQAHRGDRRNAATVLECRRAPGALDVLKGRSRSETSVAQTGHIFAVLRHEIL